MRTIQEKSAPMRDISANVRDDLVLEISGETAAGIKAVYSDKEAFYLLSLPVRQLVYCFDMRAPLPNGANRRLAKKRVQCLNEALCFVSSSVLADSLVLRNPLLRQAPKRYA